MGYSQVLHFTSYQRFCERARQELFEELGFSCAMLIHRYGLFIPTSESWDGYVIIITNLTNDKAAGEVLHD